MLDSWTIGHGLWGTPERTLPSRLRSRNWLLSRAFLQLTISNPCLGSRYRKTNR
jgi:hypothetical protein